MRYMSEYLLKIAVFEATRGQSVVKVSRNAPERRSGAPSKPKKAFRGPKMSISAPERSFRGPNDAISNYVKLLFLWLWPCAEP